MKKFLFIVFVAVMSIMTGCKGVPASKLAETMQDALGKKINETDKSLREMGFMPVPPTDFKQVYEMGDTLMTVIPQMDDKSTVGGIYLSINMADAEKALDTYKTYRDLCKEYSIGKLPYYGTKIIYVHPERQYDDIISSDNPMTIDTISANFVSRNNVNFNERWTDNSYPENRNSVAFIRDQNFKTYRVNLCFRNSKSLEF